MRISVFDIGGTWIKHALFDGETLSETSYIPTEANLGTAQMIDKLVQILQTELADGPLDAVGISTRGQVDSVTGTIVYDPPEVFPDYMGTCLPKALKEALNSPTLPVIVENDANCAAVAESVFGAARQFDCSITLAFGTGIGGGIILDGKILHGERYSAGEFGMMYMPDENGKPVYWEQLASNHVLAENPALWQRRIAMGIASVVHAFNPQCVVLGGGLMEDQERFYNLCREVYPLLAPGFTDLTIACAELKNQAGMLGAGYLAMKKLMEKGYIQS